MITLFSTNCPKCKVLEQKLKSANIDFTIQNDMQEIIDAGFATAPVLKVDNQYLDFKQAVDYINSDVQTTPFGNCDECKVI